MGGGGGGGGLEIERGEVGLPLVLALLLTAKGNFPTLYSRPSSFSASSD